uniref:Aquaporin-8-like n=1 Tax=Salarias fasciatus TaxID=181472 RepID=A0A672H4G6_SALFA
FPSCFMASGSVAASGEDKMEMQGIDSTLLKKGKKPLGAQTPNKFEKFFQPCLAEIIGTMFFVFVGSMSVIENPPGAGRLQPAVVHGLAVAVMVGIMANISGSHFNPPFTVAIYLCGNLEVMMVGPYLICQLIGGVFGAGLSKVNRYYNATGGAYKILQSETQLTRAIFAEVTLTCLLTMVVLLVSRNKKSKTPLGPFLAGSTVIINGLIGGNISGPCLNPVRAFGPAVMTNYWTYHWVYWAGPIGGGVVAAALFILGDNNLRVFMKS